MEINIFSTSIKSQLNRRVLVLALVCLTSEPMAQGVLNDGIEASVNGQEITTNAVNIIAAQLSDENKAEVERTEIVDQLINLALLSQAAESNFIHKDTNIVEALQLQYEQTLANAYVGILSLSMNVSDEELRAEYAVRVNNIVPTEFNARHILLETEQQAIDIIGKLNMGSDFADLAAEFSIDSSGKSGGDLGWVNKENYLKEFKVAVEAMDIGSTSVEPFQTRFGWHVINLIGMRGPPPPDFKEIKGELKGVIVNRKVNEVVSEMRASANVVVRETLTTE